MRFFSFSAVAFFFFSATTAIACDCIPIEARASAESNGDGSIAIALHGDWSKLHVSSGFPLNWKHDAGYAFGYESAYLIGWYVLWVVSGQVFYPDGPGSNQRGIDTFGNLLIVPFILSNFQINKPLWGTKLYLGLDHQLSHFDGKTLVEKLGLGTGYRIGKQFKLSGHIVANIEEHGISPSYKIGIKFGEYAK